MKNNKIQFNAVGIIGVGLIGGSIAMGLKEKLKSNITIFGLCRNENHTQNNIKRHIIDKKLELKKSGLNKLDVLIIATPVRTTIEILGKIVHKIPKKCLIIDVGGTKEQVCKCIYSAHPVLNFLATHPMAGSELSGSINAHPFLFQNKKWIIIKEKNTTNRNMHMVESVIQLLGAKPVYMDSQKHDEIMSTASHIPSIISSILMLTSGQNKNWNKIASVASTGFADTTRLSGQNCLMKKEIIMTNKENIVRDLMVFQRKLEIGIQLIKNNDEQQLFVFLENAKRMHDEWVLKK
jgi:prephenate dehydrogenase